MIETNKERQAPKKLEETEPSHLARYRFALEFIEDDDIVLDAPCGTGYGSALLTERSKKVYGVDISSPAIEHANELFCNDNNCFFVCDIQDMKMFKDAYFDVIVSFQGIERIKNPHKFLEEIKRVLRPEGRLIISTPRKPEGSEYHIVEFNLEEFKTILSKYFNITGMFGQIYTEIFDLEAKKIDAFAYNRFDYIALCVNR